MKTLTSKDTAMARSFTLSLDEEKLHTLFNNIDFENCGSINYAEFVGACLACKEGLRREYAELIFSLIDRDHEDTISVEDLHRFFGEDIPVYEIEAIIKQTFGCKKDVLSERDLELILNTKMITNDKTEQLVSMHSREINSYKPRKSYIDLTSLFQRIPSESSISQMKVEQPMEGIDLDEVKSEYGIYSTDDEADQIEIQQECKSETDLQELLRRSTALSFVEDITFNKINPSASPPPLMEP